MKIIKDQAIWMRKTICMSDYSEVEYGLELLESALSGTSGEVFWKQVNEIFPGISEEIKKAFEDWKNIYIVDTYITCFSEHDHSENEFGRLSMWRAYGGISGIALVFNQDVFLSRTDALAAYTSPVAYLGKEEFSSNLSKVTKNIETNAEYLKSLGRESMLGWCFYMFKYAALYTKHPGFKEEREWRVTHVPGEKESKIIKKQIVTINGIVQPICTVPLKDKPEEQLNNLHISKLLHRIIIGPCDFPRVVSESFHEMLGEVGVDPIGKIVISDIPLRT